MSESNGEKAARQKRRCNSGSENHEPVFSSRRLNSPEAEVRPEYQLSRPTIRTALLSSEERRIPSKLPSVLIEFELVFSIDLAQEISQLLESCKGDHVDRFGRLNYWKCMIRLMLYILFNDVAMADLGKISDLIGFSKDHVRKSLDRFSKKVRTLLEFSH